MDANTFGLLIAQHRTILSNFLRPLFCILKAALIPHQAWMLAHPRDETWDTFIQKHKWHILPRLIPAIRLCNSLEVNARVDGFINRKLKIWKVCPNPCRHVPGKSTFNSSVCPIRLLFILFSCFKPDWRIWWCFQPIPRPHAAFSNYCSWRRSNPEARNVWRDILPRKSTQHRRCQ
jgi:hypothetical protein